MNTENLKNARKASGKTQKDVAEYLGVGQSTYKNYECGIREPNDDTTVKLAELFNVTTDYLLGRPEAEPPADPVDEFVSKTQMLSNEQAALKKWLMLDEKKRKAVLDIMAEIIHEYESD